MITSKSGKLIIVDDEIDTLTPLCDLLSEWGYEVKGFTSGKDALEALKEKDFDLLLTDLVMPEMDGIELIKAAIKIDPLLVCMIMTGKGTIQTAVEAMKTGAFDYVLKPMEWKILKPVLSRAMEMRHLKKSEEKYRSIVEYQTELICRWKPGEILTFVNEVYCRYFNKKPEELLGQSFMTLIPEEDRDKVRSHFVSLGPENPVSTHEHHVISPNGEIRWQQWTNRALFDELGNIIEYQSVGRDITKRKLAEEALRESEERYRELAGSITDVFFAMDKDLKYIYWNKASENLTGILEKEAVGKSLYELFPDTPEIRRAEKVYLDILRTQQPQNFINRYQIGDKEYVFEINAYPSKKGLSVFVKDITERKRVEEALRVSEVKHRDLYDNAPDMYYTLNENGAILDCNETEVKMLGYEKKEIIGKHIMDFFTEESKRLYELNFPQLREKKLLLNLEREFIRKDGTTFPASLNVFSVYDENGKFIGTKTIARDISVLKQAENALRDSEEKYRTLVDNALVGVYKTNLKGNLLFGNEALARIMEFDSPEEMMAESVSKRYKDSKDREVLIGKLRENNKVENFEVDLLTKTGETRNVLLSATLEGDTISGMIMDITDRRRAEEAIRASEERYRLLFNNVSDAIFVHGVSQDISDIGKFKIIEVNDVACKYLGYTREELLQMNIAELDAPETLENIPQILNKLFTEGRATWEGIHIHKDGSRIPVEISIQLFKLYEKPMVLSSVRDITERKKAENALKESEERLRSLTEAAYEGIVFHKEGILLRANDQLFRMFGYEPDELFGKQIVQILVAPEAREFMKEQIAGGKTGPYESTGVRKDGTRFQMEIRARQTELEGEKIRVAAIMDITGRKQAEEYLKKSHEQLRALAARLTEVEEAERRRITQDLHDNVGQNLTALGINLNILPGLLSVKSKTRISTRLEDMHKLLEDTVKKIRDVMADLRPSVLDDYGLMAALRWYSEQFSNRTGITAVVHGKELEPRMPSVVETTLFRIAQEALTNVSKHAQAGKVTIKLTKKDNLIRLSIADDGIGFDPENIQQSKEKYVWGLISMKERAVAMGGNLHIKSKPGKGTTITVEILRK